MSSPFAYLWPLLLMSPLFVRTSCVFVCVYVRLPPRCTRKVSIARTHSPPELYPVLVFPACVCAHPYITFLSAPKLTERDFSACGVWIFYISGVHTAFAVPTAAILGGPDLYVDKGSTINLTCTIHFSPEPPAYIFWYHLNKVRACESFVLFVYGFCALHVCNNAHTHTPTHGCRV